jgi:hypothetical protein
MQEMKVWPFRAALRWEASNHHMLRWPKTVVVSDVDKVLPRTEIADDAVTFDAHEARSDSSA